MTDDHMEVFPLGGLGEFGMNMMAIRYAGNIIVVDAGLMFPKDDLLGVDLVVPDFTFLVENREEDIETFGQLIVIGLSAV